MGNSSSSSTKKQNLDNEWLERGEKSDLPVDITVEPPSRNASNVSTKPNQNNEKRDRNELPWGYKFFGFGLI